MLNQELETQIHSKLEDKCMLMAMATTRLYKGREQ